MTTIAKLVPLVKVDTLKPIEIHKNQSQFVLGRLPSCNHVFADLRSSSKHAIIHYNRNNNSFILEDNATNGTYLNNQKVGKRNKASLKNNDTIAFVRSRLEYKFIIVVNTPSPKRQSPKRQSPNKTQNDTFSLDPLADTQINGNNSLSNLTLDPFNDVPVNSPPKPSRKRKQEWKDNEDNSNSNNIIKSEPIDSNGPPKKKRKILSSIDDDIVPLMPSDNSFALFDLNSNNLQQQQRNNNEEENKSNDNIDDNKDNKNKKINKLKNPKRMRAGDIRNLNIEKKSGLFDGVVALIIAKKSRRLDIIMQKFIENDGELYDETDLNDNYDLIKDINTIILNKTMPFIKLTKAIKDEKLITKFHIVTLDWISESLQHKKIINTRKYIPKCIKTNNSIKISTINKSKCPAKQSQDVQDDDDEDFDINEEIEEKKESQQPNDKGLQIIHSDDSDNDQNDNDNNNNNMIKKVCQQKDDLIIEQIEDKLLMIKHKDWKCSTKILSFDMDGTVITTQSGNKFPKNYKDFRLLYDYTFVMEKKVMKYHNDGYSFVIFSNQKISHLKHKSPAKFHQKLSDLKNKVPLIMKQFRNKQNKKLIPFVFFAALSDDIYRKPHRGMFEYFNKNVNLYQESQLENSIFVGDAAGREKGWKNGRTGKADFSSSDRAFAVNCKLTFYTPEEFWINNAKCNKYRLLDLEKILKTAKTNKYPQQLIDINNGEQEMIMMIGYPGCGKSTLYKRFFYMKNYKHINRDTLGTMEKCEIECRQYLKNKYSVCIDNTNPSKMARKRFIQIANEFNIKIRAVWIETDKALSHHLNVMRWRMSDQKITKIPIQAYKQFDKYWNKPQLIEGFECIIKVPFVFDESLQTEQEFLLHT